MRCNQVVWCPVQLVERRTGQAVNGDAEDLQRFRHCISSEASEPPDERHPDERNQHVPQEYWKPELPVVIEAITTGSHDHHVSGRRDRTAFWSGSFFWNF